MAVAGRAVVAGTVAPAGRAVPAADTAGREAAAREPGNPGGSYYGNPNYNQPRQIVPQFPASSTTNQQVMYALASGTGGFPILNTNDLLPGLEKIAREQSEYYLLGYTPPESAAGSCHTLKVKAGARRDERARAQRILQRAAELIRWRESRSRRNWKRGHRLECGGC